MWKKIYNGNLVDVYRHTQQYCKNKDFSTAPSILYDIRDLPLDISNQVNENPKIIIKNMDSFEMAQELTAQGHRPLILNMASDYKFGGGVEKGSKSQEEDLFRKSSYFLAMKSFVKNVIVPNSNASNQEKISSPYPLHPYAVVYSPDVYICKDNYYDLLKESVHVSCLAVAALRHPNIKYVGKMERYRKDDDRTLMKMKIESIFQIAILNNHDSLVLGALGCGVFANPVHDVVELFREAIVKYGKYFRIISFAVLVCKDKDRLNLDCFQSLEKS